MEFTWFLLLTAWHYLCCHSNTETMTHMLAIGNLRSGKISQVYMRIDRGKFQWWRDFASANLPKETYDVYVATWLHIVSRFEHPIKSWKAGPRHPLGSDWSYSHWEDWTWLLHVHIKISWLNMRTRPNQTLRSLWVFLQTSKKKDKLDRVEADEILLCCSIEIITVHLSPIDNIEEQLKSLSISYNQPNVYLPLTCRGRSRPTCSAKPPLAKNSKWLYFGEDQSW